MFEILRLLGIEYLLCLEGVAAVLCSMAGSTDVEALLSRHGELGLAMAGERTTQLQAMLGGRARRTDRRAEQVVVGE